MLNKIWLLLRCRTSLREAGLFSVAGAGISFVSDVLAVFGPILTWLLIGVFALLVVVLVLNIALLVPRAATEIKDPLPRPLPLAADATLFLSITFLFSLGTFFGQVVADRNKTPEDMNAQGLYAKLVPAIGDMQEQLGITNRHLASVEREMRTVSEETKASREVLGKISENTENIGRALKDVKKESSEDPRKELSNIGVSWSTDSFAGAILRADMRVLELFLQGGMKPVTLHKGTSLAVTALQPGVPDRVEIFKLFMKYGFKLDTELIDTRLMPKRGMGSLPDHFVHPKLSEKYGAWNKTFAGPALLWIVSVNAYEGGTQEDFELIEFLVRNHADPTLSLAYMKLPHRTTPVEKELRAKLERLVVTRRK